VLRGDFDLITADEQEQRSPMRIGGAGTPAPFGRSEISAPRVR
jgi:hypothetical protein